MKEIIKRGNLAKKKTICPECGCEFSFEITDINTSTFACYVNCPECGYIIKDFNRTRKDFFNTFDDYEVVADILKIDANEIYRIIDNTLKDVSE